MKAVKVVIIVLILLSISYGVYLLLPKTKPHQDVIQREMAFIKFPNDWKKNEQYSDIKTGEPASIGGPNYYRLGRAYDIGHKNLDYDSLKQTINEFMLKAGFQIDPCDDGVCGLGGAEENELDGYYVKKLDQECSMFAETSINPLWEYTGNYKQTREQTTQHPPKQVYVILLVEEKECL